MKTLIEAIKKQLQTELADYIRPGDIFVTPHADFLPRDVKLPCVGIKDGGITRTELTGGCMEVVKQVVIIPWVQIHKPEASVMGDAGTGAKGVLEIGDDIHDALYNEFMDISGMQEAFSPAETGSETRTIDQSVYQKKELTYRYILEE